MLNNGLNPQLGMEPLRESWLEMLNNFALRMEVTTKEAHSTLTRAADNMAGSMTPIGKRHPCTWLETSYGSMGRTSQ